MNSQPIFVTDNQQFAELAQQWSESPLLALDTEFIRETTFYPIAGLVQLGTDRAQYLLDPLLLTDWTPLQRLFASAAPKVLHACSEDLEVFARLLGGPPLPLFDTQIGAALAGFGFSLSYQALVKACLDIEVGKEQTRSDWLRRPLSEAQCHYAALDVAYLPAIFDLIAERLQRQGRFEWWREECAMTFTAPREPVGPEQYYLKLSGGWRLQGEQVAVLQQLCSWREGEARARNVPRGRILKDAQCLDIARLLPRNLAELSAVPELHPQQIRIEGATVLELVAAARQPAESYPPAPSAPLPREWADRLKRLRQLVESRAQELDIPAELLARKRDCESLLRSGELPAALCGWRRSIIGEPLLALQKELGGVAKKP